MSSSFLSVPLFAAALAIAVTPAAAQAADPNAISDHIERRLDRRGDVIGRRLGNRGDRVERRFDRRADRVDVAGRERRAEWLRNHGERANSRLGHFGDRAYRCLDRRRHSINRRLDRCS